MKIIAILVTLFAMTFSAQGLIFRLPAKGQDVIGQLQYIMSTSTETLAGLAMEYDAGRDAVRAINPNFNPDNYLPANIPVVIPTKYILPDYPHKGIVVNISEMRLYYYPPGRDVVMTYPIGIGKPGHMTPLGATYVTHKVKDPTWTPPKSIRDYNKKKGIILPRVIRGGPDNPLGRRAIYLGIPQYLIHATNFPQSIGSRGSFGCMRMMENNIEQLFPYVANKTRVVIVEEPYKAGWSNGQLYLEIHKPLKENRLKLADRLKPVLETLMKLSLKHHVSIDWTKVNAAVHNQLGIPTVVSDASAQASPFQVTAASPKWPTNTVTCQLSGHC
jgi:L,D-transpeptidase ErfK/SrfK